MVIDGGGEYAITGSPPITESGTWPVELQASGGVSAFQISASVNDEITIAGIKFTGTWPSGYSGCIDLPYTNQTANWIIHDNYWTGTDGYSIGARRANHGGLIYNNYFHTTSSLARSIRIKEMESYTIVSGGHCSIMATETPGWGGLNFTFIEDNTFFATSVLTGSAAIDSSFQAKVAIRYNYFYNNFISIHGITDNRVRGNLASEIYNNTTSASAASNWILSLRSGTALVHSNALGENYVSLATIFLERAAESDWGGCADANPWDGTGDPTGYPCLDQPGRAEANGSNFTFSPDTSDIQPQTLWPIYFWDNSNSTVLETDDYFAENTDYYICSSSCVEGTDYPSGYSLYTYPHPLRGEDGANISIPGSVIITLGGSKTLTFD